MATQKRCLVVLILIVLLIVLSGCEEREDKKYTICWVRTHWDTICHQCDNYAWQPNGDLKMWNCWGFGDRVTSFENPKSEDIIIVENE